MTATPVLERVLRRCTEEDRGYGTPCWIYPAPNQKGYGQISDGPRTLRTHIVTYEAFIGPVPDGLQLDHLCRVKACCNPTHDDPVTSRVNNLRGDGISGRNARKTHCDSGHPFDAANTRLDRRGARRCRRCNADRMYVKRLATVGAA